ncbi:LysR family transcriptional regulator [Altericroceibacterium spongiae]|uniref:LysR family transcriptional regulator n=1 Tax=Altericroceibacterium spongiae TaxID=2320269 RepID=A0A420EKJ6_9SPHN|nr:LysR family transcriptional regulator [Altericroceibacterium spongiae]RKF21116.1 LysR family transcriptional regulator [Altericroceibacterium spongiae]
MNWDDLRHFAALASAGSLSAAARMLGVEHATVARRIASLEASLAIALVDRRGRRWSLTADGERIAAIASRMGLEAEAARRTARNAQSDLSGTVTVSAPPLLAAQLLAQPLARFQQQHPQLAIRVLGETRKASLDRSEADLAIRLSRPERGDLTIVRLGQINFHLYATPDYLTATKEEDWRFIGNDGDLRSAPQQSALENVAKGRNFAFSASTMEIQRNAAQAGAGIAALPDFMMSDETMLIRAMPESVLLSREIWLVIHSDLTRSAPVKAVAAHLRGIFAKAFAHAPSGRTD